MGALRIGFTGSSGTGKSTLARWASETYGIPLNPVGSRSVAKAMGFGSPYDVDKAGMRAEFQRRLQGEKIAWEMAHESFVTDRTTLDELAYTTIHDVATAASAEYYDAATAHVERYTHVFYLDVRHFYSVGNDPARLDNFRYQKLFDAQLRGLLARSVNQRWWRISTVHPENRQEEVARTLNVRRSA